MSHPLLDVDVGFSDRCCFRLARPLHTGLTPSLFGYSFPGNRFGCVVAERLCLRPGAGDGTRTRNLLITNQLLCQLSYASQKAIDRTVLSRTPADPSATGDREIPAYIYGNWGEVANQDRRPSSNKKTAAADETLSDATCPARGIRTR